MKLYEGKVVSEDIKIGIVAARFNEFIVSKLVSGAQDALVRHGVADEVIALAPAEAAPSTILIAACSDSDCTKAPPASFIRQLKYSRISF